MSEDIKRQAITIEPELLLDINAVLVDREGITLEQLAQTDPRRVYLAMRAANLMMADHIDRTEPPEATLQTPPLTARQSVEASMPYPVPEPTEFTISIWAIPRPKGRVRNQDELEKHDILTFVVS